MGQNKLDCSTETVEREWHRIRDEHKVEPPKDYSAEAEAVALPEPEVTDIKGADGEPITKAEWAGQKQDMLASMITSGFHLVFNTAFKLEIERDAFREFAALSAELVSKYHPDLSALEIIAKYQTELKWGWATVMLVIAISKGFKQKAINKKVELATDDVVEIVKGDESGNTIKE